MKKREIKPLIFAHRGASGLVEHENTIEAFEKAIEVGADGIELDIRKTKDNIILVHHNPNIKEYLIQDFTYEQILEISKKEGYQIPKLIDVIHLCRGKIFLDIEIKEAGYEQEIVFLLLSHLSYNQFMVRSFHQDAIIKIKELDAHITTALLIGGNNVRFGFLSRIFEIFPKIHIKKTGCNIISPNYPLLHFDFVKRMHKRNIPVSVWTVNTEKLLYQMMTKHHPDYIITNYPDLAIQIRDKIYK